MPVAAAMLLAPRAAHADSPPALAGCLDQCHGERSAERKDDQVKKKSVYVDALGLSRSEHRGMACLDCHPRSFEKDPHPAARRAYCPDCHVRDEGGDGGVAFATILSDFEKSVHFQKEDGFRCIHCHDAHTFQLDTTRSRVFEHNKVCLRCHGSVEQFQKLAQKAPPDLEEAHHWLPNHDLHWSRIRCIDCHTGYDAPPGSHLILPKAKAVKKCESCHNQNPTQLLRLYGRMRREEVKNLGFINASIVNDSYVIGATRSVWLDYGAAAIMGGSAAGIGLHGGLRILAAWRRRARKSDRGPEEGSDHR